VLSTASADIGLPNGWMQREQFLADAVGDCDAMKEQIQVLTCSTTVCSEQVRSSQVSR
jgi:hypothetical protein